MLGVENSFNNAALRLIIVFQEELRRDFVVSDGNHRFEELKSPSVWFNFHCEVFVVEVEEVVEARVKIGTFIIRVFCTRAMGCGGALVKDKGQKVIHISDGKEIGGDRGVSADQPVVEGEFIVGAGEYG